MNDVKNFIGSLHHSHIENAKQVFSAKSAGRDPHIVSPFTNFVFEFFLYNSLYSVDWEKTHSENQLTYHLRQSISEDVVCNQNVTETQMQSAIEKFCKQRCKVIDREILTDAFLPISGLDGLSDAWTLITPDSRVSSEEGQHFFRRIAEIGQLLRAGSFKPTNDNFKLICNCRRFVYMVRNNIFHGAKSLGEISDPDQARRIEVYDLFMRCLNSLCFLALGETSHGAELSQLPIILKIGDSSKTFSVADVYKLLSSRRLKSEDSMLHWKLFRDQKVFHPITSGVRRCLFYPSAGTDFLFPILVGLPYCTDFFFYDTGRERHSRCNKQLADVIRLFGQDPCITETEWRAAPCGESHCVAFTYQSIPRRAWIIHKDNLTFFSQDVPLSFYFHRGDSTEGGASQNWDSDLLPQLLSRADKETGCHVLTDAEPGGLLDSIAANCTRIRLSNSHRHRDYYYGCFRSDEL